MGKYELFGFITYSDGCTLFPSLSLFPACLIHDLEYSLGGSIIDKEAADERLYLNCVKLGSIFRAYWFSSICNFLTNSKHWGDSTIISQPSEIAYEWLDPDFDIQSNFWNRVGD